METNVRRNLLIYTIITAVSYIWFVLPNRAGISVPIFVIMQFVLLWMVLGKRPEAENKRAFLIFIPIFILSLNSFISAAQIWQGTNFLAVVALYVVMV